MRKTLIALAVGGLTSLPAAYAHNYNMSSSNMQTGRFGAPVSVVSGVTESGPVNSFIGQEMGVYPAPEMYGEVNAPAQPATVGAATNEYDASGLDQSASISRTWYMPDGSVVTEGPVSLSNDAAMSSGDLLASSSWNGLGDQSSSDYVIAQTIQPDYVIIYGE